MRTCALLLQDIRFQFKYGFYFLYAVFSVLYICLLSLLPASWRGMAAVLMVFSDPAAMGLFFMGAIVLFEKSQRVLDSIAVSPAKPLEYTASKLASIGVVATATGLLIGGLGGVIGSVAYFLVGVFLGSCLFSAAGLLIAFRVSTLNQFIVATIPAELLINVPAVAYLFGWNPRWLLLHPGVCVIELLTGGADALPAALVLFIWTAAAALLTGRYVGKCLRSPGGIKL